MAGQAPGGGIEAFINDAIGDSADASSYAAKLQEAGYKSVAQLALAVTFFGGPAACDRLVAKGIPEGQAVLILHKAAPPGARIHAPNIP
jgi:hypothetical protein